jgi:hypothetical protein
MVLRMSITFAVIIGSLPASGLAQTGTVEFSPDTSYVVPRQTFEVDMTVSGDLEGIHCYKLTIDFDRSVMSLLDVVEGPSMQAYGETFFFWIDTGGVYDIGICLLGNGLSLDGPAVMATLIFEAGDNYRSTDLEFTAVDFRDVDLNLIPVDPIDGFVTITTSCCIRRVGDANGSGGDEPTIGDVSILIDAKFISGSCEGLIVCPAEADVNQSGGLGPDCDDITIGDISILIDYLFITGPSLGLPDCL